jgi:1-deoxy-D-xylulose-5-phosphate reductoisomerase
LEVAGLVAHGNWQLLAKQCQQFRPRVAILTNLEAFAQADPAAFPSGTELLAGPEATCRLAQASDVDIVLAAVVGAAGLEGTVAALEAGKPVALANKETLIVGGPRVTELAQRRGAPLLPVDSEHSAIWQALSGCQPDSVERLVLTASGGPFRGRTADQLQSVTPAEALRHPTWQMGAKITIDSATLMNKSLEVIEAHWLFDLGADQIDVILHPESIVHSFVEFRDASVLAQLSPPDMRLPIQYALFSPERPTGPARRLNWQELRQLRFEPPDRLAFPALELGWEVIRRGGTAGAALNGANEAAVAAFLAGRIPFVAIARLCQRALDEHTFDASPTLAGLLATDRWARQEVSHWTENS